MKLDLTSVPFSRFGSYLAFGQLAEQPDQPAGMYLRTVHGAATHARNIFRLELLKEGRPVPATASATASVLTLRAPGGQVEFCIAQSKVVRARGRGVGLRLTLTRIEAYGYAIPWGEGRVRVNSFANRSEYMITTLRGQVRTESPWAKLTSSKVVIDIEPDARGDLELAIEEFLVVYEPAEVSGSFDACVRAVEQEFQTFAQAMPTAPRSLAKPAALAAYVNWSAVVEPSGHFTRPAMLMSKNWMTNVWSWDYCFNAIALAYHLPDLAWDAFMLMIDHQHESGQFPDTVNDAGLIWNFCKPPIQGWALRRMMQANQKIDRQRLAEAYEPLARWTLWWFKHRDADGDGIPQYNHGNDSGWDNATVFGLGPNIESPDLSAFLVLQMDTLAEVAGRLSKPRDAARWRQRADDLLARFLAHSWRAGRFVGPRDGDHGTSEGDSLLSFMPLVLGRRLPAEIREQLVAGLMEKCRFLTKFGLATESPRSRFYEPDGYWRGPIWAPATMLLVDGLAACGKRNLAAEIARRFLRLCARSGFAENFNAVTGAGLRDRAYTWTSSVFLVLAHEYGL